MNVELSPDTYQSVSSLVATGQYPSAEAAIAEGVRLLKKRDQLRQEIQFGIDDSAAGRTVDHDTVFSKLRATASQIMRSQEDS